MLKESFIALDPAKPWFDLSDESNKVSKGDADLVDVVHTNSGDLLSVSIYARLWDYSFATRAVRLHLEPDPS